jgi:putative DNA primase/helicase
MTQLAPMPETKNAAPARAASWNLAGHHPAQPTATEAVDNMNDFDGAHAVGDTYSNGGRFSSLNSGTDFAKLMGPVATQLLGLPAERHRGGVEWRYGARGSLSIRIDKGTFYDNEAGKGGGTLDLIQREHVGMDRAGAIAWMVEHKLIPEQKPAAKSRIVATYDYVDVDGKLLFQVVRFDPKRFVQRRPDGAGDWIWKRAEVLVLFHLPELVAAVASGRTIYIAEGEKGVLALESLGVTATCAPGGAGKWRRQYNDVFTGADVVILPDNDPQAVTPDGALRWHPDRRPVLPGQDHAADVARHLHGVAARVRVPMLPNLPPKGDVADWIADGGTVAMLEELAASTVATAPPDVEAKAEDLADAAGLVTEDSVALAFTRTHRDDLRFDHHAGAWYRWTGAAWKKEETKLAFSWARHTARKIAKASGNDKAIGAAGKAAFAAGVERFAQADRDFAVTSKAWDADPWLLGTPGGTVDLKTGKLHPARQADHITKLTAVTPAATATCPQWLGFLKQATNGDDELVGFLKRWFGYTLTGITREHALLFVFGDGGNGKGVCMNTVAGIMADYAVNAAMDSFTVSKGDKHPTDMAMLAGARMVMTTEVEEGQTWAEARLKSLTGGDPITARFMRRDFFTFVPAFKLTVSGNHKPALKNVDAAARRRFNLAPFVHRPAAPDKMLSEKLKAEWPGILRWMIEGCLEWQRDGLQQPEVVKLATEEYFQAQDTIGKWVAERCKIHPTLEVKPGLLLADCRQWAAANGEDVPTPSQFRGAMERVHGVRYVTARGIGWVRGIGLNAPEADQGGGGWR